MPSLSHPLGFPPLLRGLSPPFAESADQVAAVGEAGFLSDIVQIQIGKQQKFLNLVHPGKFDIFLAGLVVRLAEEAGKMRVTHAAQPGQLLNLQILGAVLVNVLADPEDRHVPVIDGGDHRLCVEPALLQQADQMGQQHGHAGAGEDIEAIHLFLTVVFHGARDDLWDRGGLKLCAGIVGIGRIIFKGHRKGLVEMCAVQAVQIQTVQIQHQDNVAGMFLHMVRFPLHGVDGAGVKQDEIAGLEMVFMSVTGGQDMAFDHVQHLQIIMPVRRDNAAIFGGRIQRKDHQRGIQTVCIMENLFSGVRDSGSRGIHRFTHPFLKNVVELYHSLCIYIMIHKPLKIKRNMEELEIVILVEIIDSFYFLCALL